MDTDEEQLSQYMVNLLMSIGYSKTEVSIRHLKGHLINTVITALQKFDPDVLQSFYAGSASEGLTGGLYYNGERSDYDLVYELRKVLVHTDLSQQSVKWTDAGDIHVGVEFDTKFPGYVKLPIYSANRDYKDIFVYCNGIPYLQNWLVQLETYLLQRFKEPTSDIPVTTSLPHGPAMTSQSSCSASVARVVSLLTRMNPEDLHEKVLHDFDFVSSLRMQSWPEQASNWVVRQRNSGWLSKDIIDEIVAERCLLVPVGHADNSQKQILWRISFNPAEKILLRQLSQVQLCCYCLLKIILKDFINSVENDLLSSYFMKITVFWFSEKTKKGDITEANFIACIQKCLSMLQTWLQKNHLPNYFIEEQNMLSSKFTEERVKRVIDAIDKLKAAPLSILNLKSFDKARKASGNYQEFLGILLARSILHSWVELRLGILENIHSVVKQNTLLWQGYSYFDTSESIRKYDIILNELLKQGKYLSPTISFVESSLGLLRYAEYNKKGRKFIKMKGEAESLITRAGMADVSHVPLRRATFLLMEERYDEALRIVDSVLQRKDTIVVRGQYVEYLLQYINTFVHWNIETKEVQQLTDHVNDILSLSASTDQYFEMIYSRTWCEERKFLLNMPYNALGNLCFDVSFMTAEMEALPRPVQYELLHIDKAVLPNLRTHPIIYGLFMRFQCCLRLEYKSDCSSCIQELEDVISDADTVYKRTGYNLLSSCYGQLGRQREAARCVVASLKIDPSKNNFAFSFFKNVCNIFLNDLIENKKDKEAIN